VVNNIKKPTEPNLAIRGSVEFEEVSFCYRSRDVKVLDSLSFSVRPGMFFSITGASGSGKSTVM
jgi:ABC-type bacteriocin/lantibiotic exporter with double-glycine peptidase domain